MWKLQTDTAIYLVAISCSSSLEQTKENKVGQFIENKQYTNPPTLSPASRQREPNYKLRKGGACKVLPKKL